LLMHGAHCATDCIECYVTGVDIHCPTMLAILCRRATVIRHGLVSARRQAATTLFHGQERDLATEPSLWPTQLYGTVYQQQFVKLTACIRSDASSKHICLLYVLMTDYLFLLTFVMHSRSGAE